MQIKPTVWEKMKLKTDKKLEFATYFNFRKFRISIDPLKVMKNKFDESLKLYGKWKIFSPMNLKNNRQICNEISQLRTKY